jgi:hypothetical protein
VICVYNRNRLEWHLDDERKLRTPQSPVWSCQVAGESFEFAFNRPAAAHAKSQDHRAFCGVFLLAQIGLHPIVVHLHGWLGRKHRLCDTPHISRPALIERLVKSEGHGGTRPLMKRINPSWALGLSSLNETRRVK